MAQKNKELKAHVLSEKGENMLRSVSLDCIIFSFQDGALKVLLNRFRSHDKWMIPGGFVYYNESVNDAAHRVLKERTSLENFFLNQFYLFGDKDRTKIHENEQILSEQNIDFYDKHGNCHWLLQRFISIGYYAFVDYSKVKVSAKENEEITWFDFDNIPDLYSDHNYMIVKARQIISQQLGYLPIGYELLPEKFTMTELRTIYETILGQTIDRRNFQKRMLNSGYIVKLDEISKKFGVKSTALYAFDVEKYQESKQTFISSITTEFQSENMAIKKRIP